MPPSAPPARRIRTADSVLELNSDENLSLFLAPVATPAELAAAFAAVRQRRPRSLSVAVMLSAHHSARWLEKFPVQDELIHRLVLSGPRPVGVARLDSAAYEPDPYRAVVGLMMSLRPEDAFVLVCANASDIQHARCLISQGLRWRASWDAPENGEFHPLPPA